MFPAVRLKGQAELEARVARATRWVYVTRRRPRFPGGPSGPGGFGGRAAVAPAASVEVVSVAAEWAVAVDGSRRRGV